MYAMNRDTLSKIEERSYATYTFMRNLVAQNSQYLWHRNHYRA